MAAGDVAIYRDAVGGEDLETYDPFQGLAFATQVRQDGIYTQNANDIDVDLGEAGHYLVGYAVLAGGGTVTNRKEIKSRLTLGGTALPTGLSWGFARNAANNQLYMNGLAIIEATSGQDLRVECLRTSFDNTETMPTRANKSGFWILKLDDTWSYARLSEAAGGQSFDLAAFTDHDW
ncbi:MAG: hypothetical protein V3U45_06035, partial [bacterium]